MDPLVAGCACTAVGSASGGCSAGSAAQTGGTVDAVTIVKWGLIPDPGAADGNLAALHGIASTIVLGAVHVEVSIDIAATSGTSVLVGSTSSIGQSSWCALLS